MSYGDLDFTKHLEFVEREVLAHFERKDNIPSEIIVEDRFAEPIHKEHRFMPDLMSDADS